MTETELAQHDLEEKCFRLLDSPASHTLASLRSNHVKFLKTMLGLDQSLPGGYLAFDASHPWMVFWPTNALAMLGAPLNDEELARVASTVLSYQHPDGGFGGGPGQPGHLAATYAAVMALVHTGPEYWSQINREAMLKWMLSLKTAEGSIKVCAHGEADPRASYCALAVATLLDINTAELREGVGAHLSRCQTYEGGFANEPFGEAHGGYAFCSLASLMLLFPNDPVRGLIEFCDISRFRRWLIARQDVNIGGFSGRTNKLVDGCYSHWIGGCWPLVSQLNDQKAGIDLFSRQGLHNYITRCCQNPGGGLRDKPGVRPDAYHTNYCLCGLACAQYRYTVGDSVFQWQAESVLEMDPGNTVAAINPVFGIPLSHIDHIREWTARNPVALPPQKTLTEISTTTTSSTGTTTTSKSFRPSPSSREYQGFALYVGTIVALIVYLAWALLPSSWLHSIQVDYYPSRWWAIAVPAWILMSVAYVYVALNLFNTENLTYPPTAAETICDKDTTVHDVPLTQVNERMYSS